MTMRLVLENQKVILHALRYMLATQGASSAQPVWHEVNDQMSRTHDEINRLNTEENLRYYDGVG